MTQKESLKILSFCFFRNVPEFGYKIGKKLKTAENFFVLNFVFVEFREQIPINHIPVNIRDIGKLKRYKVRKILLLVIGIGRFRDIPRRRKLLRRGIVLKLRFSGTNNISNVIFKVRDTSIFNQILHNKRSFIEIAVSSDENANDSAINIVAIVSKNFLPVINGIIDVMPPKRRDRGIFSSVFFKFLKFVKVIFQIRASQIFITAKLLNGIIENINFRNGFNALLSHITC